MATNNVAPEWQNQTINYDPVTRTTTGTVIARDADGDTLRYYLIGSSYAGSATVTANGSYVYTPFYTGPNGYWNYDYIPVAITDGQYTTYAWIYVDTYTSTAARRARFCKTSRPVSRAARGTAGAKLPGSSTSFNDPSREAEKEVRVALGCSPTLQTPTGN